jgi:hypothetical protein
MGLDREWVDAGCACYSIPRRSTFPVALRTGQYVNVLAFVALRLTPASLRTGSHVSVRAFAWTG